MCQVNNVKERNILREEEDQIGREPIQWRRRRKEKEKEKKEKRKRKERKRKREGKKQCVGEKKEKGEREREDFPGLPTVEA